MGFPSPKSINKQSNFNIHHTIIMTRTQMRSSKMSTQSYVLTQTPKKRRKTAAVNQNPTLGFDACYEILLRVDPSFIFNCTLVSKEWLETITGPEFRRRYEKRWKNSSKLVGFLKSGKKADKLLPTCELGRIIQGKESIQRLGDFICKSGAGDGLVLSRISPKMFFISKPIAGDDEPFRLPEPPVHIPHAAMAIFSEVGSSSYKIIRAEANLSPERTTLRIQTFSSFTGMWEKFTLSRSAEFTLTEDPGIATSDSVVYFRAVSECLDCLAAYEPDNGRVISLIHGPELEAEKEELKFRKLFPGRSINNAEPLREVRISRSYGLCGRGYLRCASRRFGNGSMNDETIKIWGLDNIRRDWNLLYKVDPMPILPTTIVSGPCSRSAAEAVDLRRPSKAVGFVSFVPGRSDAVYLTWQNELFAYNFDTKNLERLDHRFEEYSFKNHTGFIPLTMAELGVWPSCPLITNDTWAGEELDHGRMSSWARVDSFDEEKELPSIQSPNVERRGERPVRGKRAPCWARDYELEY